MTTNERLRELVNKRNEADKAWRADPHNQYALVNYSIATAVLEREASNALPALLAVVDAAKPVLSDYNSSECSIYLDGMEELGEALANLEKEQ